MADLLNEEPIAEEAGVGIGTEVPPVAEEGPLGSKLSLTVDDIPELADLQPGDVISFTIDDITEEGNYSLTVSPVEEALEEPLPEELPPEGPAPGGQEAVLNQLAGTI